MLLLSTEHHVDWNTVDYSLANPDTLTKYKTAAQITHKVLETVTGATISNPGRHQITNVSNRMVR